VPLASVRTLKPVLELLDYYVDCYNGATSSSEPPSSDYTFLGRVKPDIKQLWLRGGWSTPSYYNTDFMHPDTGRSQKPLWAPSSMNSTSYALVYTFTFYVSQAMNISTEAFTDDGLRVYIDGNLVLNAWNWQNPTKYNFTLSLSEGQHTATVKYMEGAGQWVVVLGNVFGYPFFFNARTPSRVLNAARTLSPAR